MGGQRVLLLPNPFNIFVTIFMYHNRMLPKRCAAQCARNMVKNHWNGAAHLNFAPPPSNKSSEMSSTVNAMLLWNEKYGGSTTAWTTRKFHLRNYGKNVVKRFFFSFPILPFISFQELEGTFFNSDNSNEVTALVWQRKSGMFDKSHISIIFNTFKNPLTAAQMRNWRPNIFRKGNFE